MAEAQNPEGEPQKQFDTENIKEAKNIGDQLKQTFKEASARANDFRFAMESSVAAATKLSKAAQLVSFNPDLEASFKIFQEDSKGIIKNFKQYPTLLEKARKSNQGLADIEKIIQSTVQDTEGIRRATDSAADVAAAARAERSIKETRLQEYRNKLDEVGLQLLEASNQEKLESSRLRSLESQLTREQNKLTSLGNLATAASLSGQQDKADKLLAQQDAQQDIIDSLTAEVAESERLNGLAQRRVTDLQQQEKAEESNIKKTSEAIKNLEQTAVAAEDYAKSLANSLHTAEAFNQELTEMKNQTLDLNKATKVYGTLANIARSEFLQSLPIIGQLAGQLEKAEEAARQLHIETEGAATQAQLFGAGLNVLAYATLGGIFGGLVKAISHASEEASTLAMQINISQEAGAKLRDRYKAFADQTGQAYTNANDFIDAQTELNQLLGTSAAISMEQGQAFSYMVDRLGVAGSSAAALLKYTSAIGANAQDFSEQLVGQVQLFNMQNDQVISYSEVMEDIAKTSAATRLTLSKFPGGITRAALQARNLGLTLDDIVGASESFLDFESSIQAELEAELLTGKQLNLEQARLAALKGDTAKVAEEIAKQNISAADFAGMNVIQQEALAKAVGLTKDQLAESLENQEAQAAAAEETKRQLQDVFKASQQELAAEGITDVDQFAEQLASAEDLSKFQEQINLLNEKGATEALDKVYTAQTAAAKKAIEDAKNETDRIAAQNKLKQIQQTLGKSQKAIDDRNLSNQEKFANAQKKLGDAFVGLVARFEPFINKFADFVGSLTAGDFKKIILSLTAASAGFIGAKKIIGLVSGKLGFKKSDGSSNAPFYVRMADGVDSIGKSISNKFKDFFGKRDKAGRLRNAKGQFKKSIGSRLKDTFTSKKGKKSILGKGADLLGGFGKKGIGKGLGKGLLKGAKGLLGKAALPIAALTTLYDGFKGFTADKDASFGDKLKNAGSSAVNGLTFGLLGKDADEIKAEAEARKQAKGNSIDPPTPKVADVSQQAGSETATNLRNRQIEEQKQRLQERVEIASDNGTLQESSPEVNVPDMSSKFDMLASKLEMINSSIMQGGDVYIDGNKAGQALVLASTKMS